MKFHEISLKFHGQPPISPPISWTATKTNKIVLDIHRKVLEKGQSGRDEETNCRYI